MIETSELRIGNYIAFIKGKAWYKVEEIRVGDRFVFHEPILLTPEVLDKLKFDSVCGKPLYRKFLPNGDELLYSDGHLALTSSKYTFQFEVKCPYLHKLQNIYFELWGKELEI